jgi:hypothetical protein
VVTGAQSQAAQAESRASQGGQDETESAREDRTEAELQRPSADPDEAAAGQPARQQPKSTTRRSRHPRKK